MGLTGIPPAPRGTPQIEVTFDIEPMALSMFLRKTREQEKNNKLSSSPPEALAMMKLSRWSKMQPNMQKKTPRDESLLTPGMQLKVSSMIPRKILPNLRIRYIKNQWMTCVNALLNSRAKRVNRVTRSSLLLVSCSRHPSKFLSQLTKRARQTMKLVEAVLV